MAAALGWAGNRLVWRLWRGRGTAVLVPLWEETVKSGIGVWTGSLFITHALFGLGEALVELARAELAAACLALVSHGLFGALAVAGWRLCASPLAGWLTAALAHLSWNMLVLRFADRTERRT